MSVGGFGKQGPGSRFVTVTIAVHERGEGDSFKVVKEVVMPVECRDLVDYVHIKLFFRNWIQHWNHKIWRIERAKLQSGS